jgi:diguanylate cyclase
MSDSRQADIKQAGLRSRSVLAWLRDHKLPAEPICYTLVYECLYTENLKFKQSVGEINLEVKEDNNEIEQIYKDYITSKHYTDFNKQELNIKGYVTEILTSIVQSRGENRNITNKLVDKSVEVEPLTDQYLEIKESSSIDELTQILDQKGLMTTLNSAIKHEENYPLSVIRVDIDHFKQFNDTNGEKMANAVLKQIAKVFTNQLKGSDIISRFEEDEFLVILPKTHVDNGMAVAQILRKKVESISLKKKGALAPVKVTTSSGVSVYEGKGNFNIAMENAKKAMQRSKVLGRNCVNKDV